MYKNKPKEKASPSSFSSFHFPGHVEPALSLPCCQPQFGSTFPLSPSPPEGQVRPRSWSP